MSEFTEVTYSSKQVVCEKPRIIINPLLPELLSKYGMYVFRNDVHYKKPSPRHLFCFDYKPFAIKRNDITREDIESCYVCDQSTGETFPIYIEVPCNHCDICKERKIASFVQRCKFETQCYDCKPWFVTLTYDNQHVPVHGVSVDEAQRFLKRLRINLVRAGFNSLIRYVLVGEYGKNTHRPHYHAIFWNIGAKSHQEYLKLVDILDRSWSCGFIQHRIINPENDKAFYYTAKYLKKDCFVPKGCNPTFLLSSRGHGGIGARFIDGIANEVRRTLNVSYKFLNKWSQKLEEVVFSQYVLNRIFPSFCKAVPSVLRKSLADFSNAYSTLVEHGYNSLFNEKIKNDYERFSQYFSPHVFFRVFDIYCLNRDARYRDEDALQAIADNTALIEQHYGCYDFSKIKEIAEKREKFCTKLFLYSQPVDIGARKYRATRNFGLSAAREVL